MSELWYSDSGAGDALLVLHPGATDSRSMQPLVDELPGYRVIAYDRRGHGRTADVAGEWSFADMADDAAALLRALSTGPAHVVGWSDGAIVGLELALRHPDLVRSLVFGGAPFDLAGWHDGVLGDETPEFLAEAYGEVSPDGVEHWAAVVAKSDALHAREPRIPVHALQQLRAPVLVLSGDDDEVRIAHLVELYEALPDGELAIVPRATHALPVEKPELVARLLRDFHADERSNGYAPRRRAEA